MNSEKPGGAVPRMLRLPASRHVVVAAAAVVLAAGALGLLIWALASSRQLAWLTSISNVLAVDLAAWTVSAGMLAWVIRSRKSAADGLPAQASRHQGPAPGQVSETRGGQFGSNNLQVNLFTGGETAHGHVWGGPLKPLAEFLRDERLITPAEDTVAELREANRRQELRHGKSRSVEQWSAHRLGVHPAIPGRLPSHTGRDFVLPAYVLRDNDAELRAFIDQVAHGSSACFAVLLGRSCTGKTRAAYEAVHAVVPSWQLLFPDDSDDLLAMLVGRLVGAQTVLWLDEAQDYLYGLDGESAAAALRRRLEQPGPALILATMWPEYYRDLTAATGTGAAVDLHPHARALLAGAHRFDVPASFTGHSVAALQQQATRDPSLAAAARYGATTVTQILAAGPDLVEYYEHPVGSYAAYGQALLTAAMDAHRFGVTGPLPLALLLSAAPGYIEPDLNAAADGADWAEYALVYARTTVKGAAVALHDVPYTKSSGSGLVRLADYLGEHGRSARRFACPPQTFWDTASEQLEDPLSLALTARAAGDRLRYRHAELLYRKAHSLGHPSALGMLSLMWSLAGQQSRSSEISAEGMAAGDEYVWNLAAQAWYRIMETGQAEHVLREGAGHGHARLWESLAWMRANDKDRKGVGDFIQRAVEAGHEISLETQATLWEVAGEHRRAERLYLQAAGAGNANMVIGAARLREQVGDRIEAERLYRQAGDAGEPDAARRLAQMLSDAGDLDAIDRLASAATAAGDADALAAIARARESDGDRVSAERIYRQSADLGNTHAVLALGWIQERAGDQHSAESFYQQAVDGGQPSGLSRLADLHERTGSHQAAELFARRAADAGYAGSLVDIAKSRAGHEWQQLLRYGLASDGTTADPW